MAKWLRLVAESRATWIWFMMSAETLCSASAILRGTEPVSALTRALVYCCTLQNFLLLGFCQWRSRADRVVNLNTTIWLPLFWRTWTRARASTRPHVLAWHMGRDYSDCRASELTDRQVSGFVFSWFLKKIQKNLRPHERLQGFSKAHAPGWHKRVHKCYSLQTYSSRSSITIPCQCWFIERADITLWSKKNLPKCTFSPHQFRI